MYRIAEQVGSDVPFALYGGTALAEEKGQILSRRSPMPDCVILLCKPGFPISTPELFRAIDLERVSVRPETEKMCTALQNMDLRAVASLLCNVFEPVVLRDHPEIQEIENTMLSCGALNACMTGSGPTVFGLFERVREAKMCLEILSCTYKDTFLTHPV